MKGIEFGKKFESKTVDFVPGPGTYELNSSLNDSKGFVIGTKYQKKTMQTPGPGDYEMPESHGVAISILG